MSGEERLPERRGPDHVWEGSTEPGARPISESRRRHSVTLTPLQSDALARLLVPGVRRLVELFSLRNGTVCATLRGGGHAALRVYVTPDGRVEENEEASEPDPLGEETAPFVLARERDRLHLGTLLPPDDGAPDPHDARAIPPTDASEAERCER